MYNLSNYPLQPYSDMFNIYLLFSKIHKFRLYNLTAIF